MRTTLGLLVAMVVGCSSPKTVVPDLAQSLPDLATAQRQPACLPTGYAVVPFVTDVAEHDFTDAAQSLTAGLDYIAVLETDAGCIVLDLYENDTPITVNSFVFLTQHHFFDGIAFHRVIDGFVAQAGDPNTLDPNRAAWGTGGPGYTFGLEVVPTLNYDTAGVLGMARSMSPSSNGSQFFITLAAATNLNQKYTIFGKVLTGLDVLPKIVRGEPPTTPTLITAATIAVK